MATVTATCLGACQISDLDPPPSVTDTAHHGENDDNDDNQRACDWRQMVATIRLPGVGDDPRTFVAGGLAVDRHGNVYYNALALAAGSPFDDPRGAWLVKVRPDDTVKLAEFATIAVGAPGPGDACVTQFSEDEGPWPPSPDAVPPSAPCGAQRPPINVTPAVGEDGSVVTISTASNNPAYTFVVEVDADLAPKWTASLRDKLHDGCGVLSPSDLPPTETDARLFFARCRVGATVGVALRARARDHVE